MTSYQTEIQNLANIRFGSAKVELYDDTLATPAWVNLGAIKSLVSSTETEGEQEYAPDNTAPITKEPVPKYWVWEFDMQEAWNPSVLKLLRGGIDTYAESTTKTTMGIYAGNGTRPYRKVRFTNTVPGQQPVVIELRKAKLASDIDWNFPTDKDGTTAIALHIKLKAELDGSYGFGTVDVPKASGSVTISPEMVSLSLTGTTTQQMTVTSGGTAVAAEYGMLNNAVATVSTTGLVTAVAAGQTQLIITANSVTYYIPVLVEA